MSNLKCHTCGKFMVIQKGCAWQMRFLGYPTYEPFDEIYRCLKCTNKHGEFKRQDEIKMYISCGIVNHEFINGGIPEFDGIGSSFQEVTA